MNLRLEAPGQPTPQTPDSDTPQPRPHILTGVHRPLHTRKASACQPSPPPASLLRCLQGPYTEPPPPSHRPRHGACELSCVSATKAVHVAHLCPLGGRHLPSPPRARTANELLPDTAGQPIPPLKGRQWPLTAQVKAPRLLRVSGAYLPTLPSTAPRSPLAHGSAASVTLLLPVSTKLIPISGLLPRLFLLLGMLTPPAALGSLLLPIITPAAKYPSSKNLP